jgi:hypothetical protein
MRTGSTATIATIWARALIIEEEPVMTLVTMTRTIAFAAAQDFGNKRMRAGGRRCWSLGDYRAACAEFERLAALINPREEGENDETHGP